MAIRFSVPSWMSPVRTRCPAPHLRHLVRQRGNALYPFHLHPPPEAFYWLTILFTFALRTARGDLVAEKLGVGYLVTGLIVVGVVAALGLAWRAGLDAVLGATVTSAVFLGAILAVVIYLAVTHKDRIDAPPAPSPIEKKGRAAIVQAVVVVAVLVGVGVTGYYLRSSQLQKQAAASASPDRPLGDLSAFRTIATDMLGFVRSGVTSLRGGAYSAPTNAPSSAKVDSCALESVVKASS